MSKRLVKAPLKWCTECNVPVLSHGYVCEVCGSHLIEVRATAPADVRLMFDFDYRMTVEAIKQELGSEKAASLLLPKGHIVLLNKIPYVDAADEVIIDGMVIGHRFYDPLSRKWRFKVLYQGVTQLIEAREGYYAIVDLPKMARDYVVHKSHIVEANMPPSKGHLIPLQTKNGRYQGVGKVVRKGRIRILKAWTYKEPYYGRGASIDDVIRANENRLKRLMTYAEAVFEEATKYRKPFVVSFSGGKDSLVALHLALRFLGDVKALFSDTGLELPETYASIDHVADGLGVEIARAQAGNIFFRAMEILGPPARDYRWCCKVCKLAPMVRYLKRQFPEGNISIVGQRKYESAARARMPILTRSKILPTSHVIAPINEWTSLDVWIYIIKEGLRPNPLYFKGFDRVGCWLCPACELAELELVKMYYPALWEMWEKALNRWAERHGLHPLWMRFSLWRWHRLPGDMRRFLENMRFNVEKMKLRALPIHMSIEQVISSRDTLTISLRPSQPLDLKRVSNIIVSFTSCYEVGHHSVVLNYQNSRVEIAERSIKITSPIDIVETIVQNTIQVIVRALLCVACGFCVERCPREAIILKDQALIKDDLCLSCNACLKVCPVSQNVGRELSEEIIERIREFIKRPWEYFTKS